jgi:hypothetical protein
MRGCAPAAIAILALEACAPSGSAKRSASFLADLPAFYTECTTTRTPEAYANCRAAQLRPLATIVMTLIASKPCGILFALDAVTISSFPTTWIASQ